MIPRIGASITFYGLAVLRQFEMMGVWPLNESVAIGRSRDKLRSLQLLSREGIGLPVTGFANSARQAEEMIKMVNGPPVVIKLLEGTQGIGVILSNTMSSAKSVFEAFRGAKINILVQEFIKEAGGADIRAFVVGNRVVGAMMRQGEPGEFRSNLHRGGSTRQIRITPRGALDRRTSGQGDGSQCRRRRSFALQPRTRAYGGKFIAGTGGNREGDGFRYRWADHLFYREPCQTYED